MSYQNDGENGLNGEEIPDKKEKKGATMGLVGIGAICLAIVLFAAANIDNGNTTAPVVKEGTKENVGAAPPVAAEPYVPEKIQLFDEAKRYVIQDYDAKPTFSSFLPGVAGIYGKPVWCFYVNRGQGVASFGTVSKEYPMLEFNAANKAYQLTAYIGFRSFLTASREGQEDITFEPFSPSESRIINGPDELDKPKRMMYVGPNEMEVEETDKKNGITTKVKYIVLPEEDFSALLRRTTITNDGDTPVKLSILDGLAKIEPSGGQLDWGLKNMGRTLEGWMGVQHINDTLTMPFYKMSTEPSDTASVKIEEAGHYCLSFIESEDGVSELLPVVFDSSKVFGQDTNLMEPTMLEVNTVGDILKNPQYGDAKTSSAFAAVEEIELGPGESVTVASFYGKAEHAEEVPKIAETVLAQGYVQSKIDRARTLINELTSGVETNTTHHLFDGAIKQMFLDNSLRGGLPQILGDIDEAAKHSTYDEDERVKVYHTFSRIHGDLERDYNAFNIKDSYFSQGPGNFRDVAQNRREDVSFLPRMGSFDVQEFLSFIQADAYEPLTVEAVVYMMEDEEVAHNISVALTSDPDSQQTLQNILLGGAYRPGQLFDLVVQLNVVLAVDNDTFINQVLAVSKSLSMAVYGTGYWSDHWEYYLDLIDSYLAIYPDGEEALMYDQELRYFFSTATVRPRSQKYVETLTFDGKGKHIQQLDSTYYDQGKEEEQEAFRNTKLGILKTDAYWQRTDGGPAFKSTPIAKLFLLAAVKFATRDAYGMGVEYEGGRPGWNDAMNGLPGMVGSGMPETFELYELLRYIQKVVSAYQRPLVVPTELWNMINETNAALDVLEASGFDDSAVSASDMPFDVPEVMFTYWDTVATAREAYRNKVEYYFSGETEELGPAQVLGILDRWRIQVVQGIERSKKIGSHGYNDDGTSGVPPAYFSFHITKWEETGNKTYNGLPLVNALSMRVGRFPLFLESPVRYMKTINSDQDALRDLYQRVYSSGLRDTELNMYFLSADLKGQSYDMGRMMAFAPGWLENQSVWMHMSYKYYLQLLRGKLYDEFFSEMRGGGVLPFMDPDVYGRSLMECSSFIASGAFKDPSMVGRGFSARLSGSTAEFLSMWKLMFVGPNPFIIGEDGEVQFQLVPTLPIWFFDDAESGVDTVYDSEGNAVVSFKLFAQIPVTYHNVKAVDLFDVPASKYVISMADGTEETVEGNLVPNELAVKIRRMYDVESMDVYF